MKRTFLLGSLLVVSSMHCGSSASSPPSDDADAGAGVVSPAPGSDGGVDACAATSTSDDPDDDGIDTNCDGADGVVGVDVYVDNVAGLNTNAATPSAPLKTLAAGIPLAISRHGRVLVAGGTYAGADLSTLGTWALYGGYPSSFLGQPKRENTVVAAGATGALLEGAITASLAHLTIQGAAATDPTSPGAHALRVNAQTVTLDDVALIAGDGFSPGATASPPQNAATPAMCTLALASPSPPGANGVWGNPGTAPGVGATGQTGQPGQSATGTFVMANELVSIASDGSSGGTDATRGSAGGGGAQGNATSYEGMTVQVSLWPNEGFGGAGGCPGAPGAPGASGGSSVALLALGGTVTVARSAIQTGVAGTGGDGASGGEGGVGAPGAVPILVGTPAGATLSPTCATPADDNLGVSCIEYGAQGGMGGTGGHGGAGAGGWNLGIVSAAGVTVSVDRATTFTLGRAGDGGSAGDGGFGPPGRQQSRYTIGQ